MANPTPPKIQLSPEEFAQVNEGAATSLTQDWSPVDQGLAGQIAEREQLLRAQPLEMAIADDKRSTWDTWQAGLQETETAYLLRAYLEDRDEMFPRHDLNFDIKREYGDIIRAHGIQDNDNNLAALAKATSSEEASWIATSIADKEAREAILARYGVVAFTTGMVDPLTILADMATYGGTRALKMGRLSSAIAGGGSAVAVSAMADYAGKDYEVLDHAINFGVTAGAFALVGGSGLEGLRRTAGNDGVTVRGYHFTTEDIQGPFRNQKNRLGVSFAGTRGFYFTEDFADETTTVFGNKVVEANLKFKNPAIAVPGKAASWESKPKAVVNVPLPSDLFAAYNKSKTRWVGDEVAGARQKAAAGKLTVGIDPERLDDWDVQLLARAGYDGIIVRGTDTSTPAQVVALYPEQIAQLQQGIRHGFQPSAPLSTPPSTVSTAPGLASRLNDFLSETDKLISPSAESAALLANVVDDPVRRAGILTNDNAASTLRVNSNVLDGTFAKWTESLERVIAQREGLGTFSIKMDASGRYGAARDALERKVAEELARRDAEWTRFGAVADVRLDPDVKRLADEYEQMMTQGAELAKRQGLAGFEDFAPRPGYFHRSWSESKIRALEDAYGRKTVKNLLTESIVRGLRLTKKEAGLISTAILTRTRTKAAGLRPEFMGALGKTDTDAIRTMLVEAGTDDATIKSVMGRIEQNLDEAGKSKYSKTRLPLDMTVKITTPDGRTISVLDMIDTDLSRLAENYNQQMAGRSALAAAGVGGDDASIQALRGRYYDTLVNAKLKDADIDDRMLQFDHLMSDFTGNRPPGTVLGVTAQRAKSLAQSTMLVASGLWQVAEYGTLAYRHGAARTTAEFFKQFPGVAGYLRKVGRDPDLYDELTSVVGLDLARDVRVRPWLRQYEANLTARDTLLDRVLYLGNQATPILNGMKLVHTHQVRLNANLTMNTIGRAVKGDRKALQMLREYGLDDTAWGKIKKAVDDNAEFKGKNVKSMNWDGWPQDAVDAALNVGARIMDDTILYGRAGQGSSFARSQLGQILGQFRSFVSFAHNKLLRGTIQNSGYTGLAVLLAYQYPLTMMMVAANELRKGESVDLESEAGLMSLASKALGYTAGIGFIGDAAGIVGLTGGRGGLSAPVLGLANAPGSLVQGTGHLLQGEGSEALADYMQAARTALPFVGVFPGTALLQNALKE